MKIESKFKRVLAMFGIGAVLVLIFSVMGLPRGLVTGLTAGILFFAWPWLGGKWFDD